MLKPKRKILRKEIQRDPFLESIFSLREHLVEKKQIYTRGAIVLVGIVLLGYLYTNNHSSNRKVAENVMSKVMVFVDLGDNDNAKIHLQELVDEYGSTNSGKNASFYLGRIHFDNGEYDLALPHLERFAKKGENVLLTGSTYEALVNIYQSNDDLTNAIRYQRMALVNANSQEEEAWASLKLANLLIANHDSRGAMKLVETILKNFDQNQTLKQKANEIMGKVNTGEED